jgi:hypothetical protein
MGSIDYEPVSKFYDFPLIFYDCKCGPSPRGDNVYVNARILLSDLSFAAVGEPRERRQRGVGALPSYHHKHFASTPLAFLLTRLNKCATFSPFSRYP